MFLALLRLILNSFQFLLGFLLCPLNISYAKDLLCSAPTYIPFGRFIHLKKGEEELYHLAIVMDIRLSTLWQVNQALRS